MIKSESIGNDLSGHFTLAGWVAIAQAVLLVPQLALAIGVEFLSRQYPELKLVSLVMKVVGVAAGVYVLYMFRRLLNDRFGFHDVDIFITVFIALNVISFFLGIAGMFEDFEIAVAIIVGILFLVYGILSIAFGVTILKLKDNLFGLLRPYAYLTIGSGILAATILLAPIGMILSMTALVVQGMIFLRAREESEYL